MKIASLCAANRRNVGVTQVKASYLPGVCEEDLHWESRVFQAHGQSVEVVLPVLTPAQLQAVSDRVRTAAKQLFAPMRIMEIVDVLDRVIARMLDVNNPTRRQMEALLPVVSGFDAEMTRLGMNACLKSFRRPQLLRFLLEDFGDPALLDEFRPRARGGWTRACGPDLLAHVWAGNVPGLPLWSMVAGLLVKAGNLGKVSSAEPLFATWFAETLAEVEPRLSEVLAVVWWPGGSTELEEVVCREADVFKVYGGDTALRAWQRQLPAGKRLLPHGHKISVGLVSATALDTRHAQLTARQAALDMVRWDQQGCYSPQAFYVERGGQVTPDQFARDLAGELSALGHSFPRRSIGLKESTSRAQWQQTVELAQLRGQAVELLGSKEADWRLAYLDTPGAPQPSALNRTAAVMAVERLEDAMPLLETIGPHLQTVGLAASPEVLFSLAPHIAGTGATRICALGSMTTPAPGWHHDGRFSLLDLVRMVDIDASAEDAAEAFAAYRD